MWKLLTVIFVGRASASPACDSETSESCSTEESALLQFRTKFKHSAQKSSVGVSSCDDLPDCGDDIQCMVDAMYDCCVDFRVPLCTECTGEGCANCTAIAESTCCRTASKAGITPDQCSSALVEEGHVQAPALPHQHQSFADVKKMIADEMEFVKKLMSSVPESNPMWSVLRQTTKAMMLATSQDAREWITWAKDGEWELYNNKSCNFAPGGAPLPDPGSATNTTRPADAFYCGHPAVDWSGEKFGGKPENDLCNAEVGDASKPSLCGKYSDKQIVMGLLVGEPEIKEDSRNVNIMTVDCLMDIVDGDIYYCQKCSGRCHG